MTPSSLRSSRCCRCRDIPPSYDVGSVNAEREIAARSYSELLNVEVRIKGGGAQRDDLKRKARSGDLGSSAATETPICDNGRYIHPDVHLDHPSERSVPPCTTHRLSHLTPYQLEGLYADLVAGGTRHRHSCTDSRAYPDEEECRAASRTETSPNSWERPRSHCARAVVAGHPVGKVLR